MAFCQLTKHLNNTFNLIRMFFSRKFMSKAILFKFNCSIINNLLTFEYFLTNLALISFNPIRSSVTKTCPSQCTEAPIPIVGIFRFLLFLLLKNFQHILEQLKIHPLLLKVWNF